MILAKRESLAMKTILVVDDMAIFREPIEAVLRAEGFETISASNGQGAIFSLAKQTPDLIVLDLGMPVLDGLAVLRYVRSHENLEKVPVIVLSAESDRARVVQAVKLGIACYLLKANFSLKELLNRVREVLDGVAKGNGAPPTPAAKTPEAGTAVSSAAPRAVASTPAVDLKSIKPVITRSDLLERVKACEELKGFSPTVSQVLNLTASATCSVDAVSKAVRQDQAMALKILKVANSSAYSRDDRVDTVHKAILRIGMQSIRQVVMSIAVVENFSSPAFGEQISTRDFWEHSIACGIIAAEIAHEMGDADADSAFTSGLLHDLGRVILAEALGTTYVETIETARRLGAPLEAVESRMLLINHADIMDRLLSAWHFPKHLVDPIMYHHLTASTVRSVTPSRTREVLRLGLANRLAHAMLLGGSGNETIYSTEEHCRALNIEPKTIERIEQTARQQTDDTKFALLVSASTTPWPRAVDRLRKNLGVPFRPHVISAAPALDAMRIFCTELAGPMGAEPPNVIVAHLSHAKNKAAVGAALSDPALRALPIVLLAPPGAETGGLPIGDRVVLKLETPFAISRFIERVRAILAPGALADAA